MDFLKLRVTTLNTVILRNLPMKRRIFQIVQRFEKQINTNNSVIVKSMYL